MLETFKKLIERKQIDARTEKPSGKKNSFSKDLSANVRNVKSIFSKCDDFTSRPLKIGLGHQVKGYFFYLDGLVDNAFIADNILSPLMVLKLNKTKTKPVYKEIYDQLLTVGSVKFENDIESFVSNLLSGSTGLLLENQRVAITIEVKGWRERAVEEPPSETVIKGARVGFIENIRANTAMLRRVLKTPSLKIERLVLGSSSRTEVNIAYVQGVVKKGLVEEVKERLSRIDSDEVITVGTLQEAVDDSIWSIFSQTFSTERPERVCSCLIEGQVAILMDNTPFVFLAPSTVAQLFQAADDYNAKYYIASFTRILRAVSVHLTLLLPGVYVALFSYHHEMIPTELLRTVSRSREKVPFPVFLEMFLLESAFEILREAGVRLPRAVGQAVSIVGALVIGQAAVSAGLVSPASIIVVALTAISSFTIPLTEGANTYRVLRFPVLAAAGFAGFPGLIAALLFILVHVSGLRSFGVPYLAPVSPFTFSDWKDFLIRLPFSYLKTRPRQTGKSNFVRQGKWEKQKGGK